MSKFPVESSDVEGIVDGLNYVLSGPGGLGQNFAGFSAYTPAYLTGNFRIPYSQPGVAQLYVAPIDIDFCEMLDSRTVKVHFLTTQSTIPFSLGNGLSIEGVDVPWYNNNGVGSNDGVYVAIGVVECTSDYVIIRSRNIDPIQPNGFGGTIKYFSVDYPQTTDCLARVLVNSVTDRVFISAQLDNTISYEVFSGPATLTYYVDVYRLRADLTTDPTNPDYVFNYDEPNALISEKVYTFTDLTGTGTLPIVETVFATIIDQPTTGYFRYEIEVYFKVTEGDFQITTSEMGVRCLSAQVVKQ